MSQDNPHCLRPLLADLFNGFMLPAAGYKYLPGRFALSKHARRMSLATIHRHCRNLPELP